MADNEVSKITWLAIVVALAGSIYGVSKTRVPTLTNAVFDKIGKIKFANCASLPANLPLTIQIENAGVALTSATAD